MLSVVITSALFGIAAILIRKAFGSKVGIRAFMIMWAAVFLKFAVPIQLPSPFSMMNLFHQSSSSTEEIMTPSAPEEYSYEYTEPEIIPAPETEHYYDISPARSEPHASLADIAAKIYLAVAVMLISCVIFAYMICLIKFSHLPLIENETCKNVIKGSGIKRKITVRKGNIDTPAVFGTLSPMIILPESIDMTDEKLVRHIMLHETSHIKHSDPLWNIFTLIISAANWFDPVVWICRALYLSDTEKLCDMNVVKIIGIENRKEYADSLLACAASKSRPIMLVSGFGESGIKSRIKSIMTTKKVRVITVAAAAAVMIISAVIFGTGRNISVDTRDVSLDSTAESSVYHFTQILEDDNGEAGRLDVTVNVRDAYYVDISFESEKYTLTALDSLTVLSDVTQYRIYSDSNDKGEYNYATNTTNGYWDDVTYEKELDISFPHYVIDAAFDRYNSSANIRIDLDYKLKKGIFSAGSHYFTCSFDPFSMDMPQSDSADFALIDNSAGYTAEFNNSTGEYELHSVRSDVVLTVSDSYNGFYAQKTVNGSELRRHFDMSISPKQGTSDVSEIFLRDLNSDGTNDIIIITYYLEDSVTIINGADLSEIVIDNTAVNEMLGLKITQLSDTEFNVSCAGSEHVFTLDSPVDTKRMLTDNGEPKCSRTPQYTFNDNEIYAEYILNLCADENPFYRYLTNVQMTFEYSDGKLIPQSAEMDTSDDIYYIKGEPAAKAKEIFYSYDISGYTVPYSAELVMAEDKYRLRIVNKLTGAYCGSCELPVDTLPDNIDDCFRFTGLNKNNPGLIIFTVPYSETNSADDTYLASFFNMSGKGKIQRMNITDSSGKTMNTIRISDNFTAQWAYMADTYQSSSGKVDLRIQDLGSSIYIIDMLYNTENYRAIDSIDIRPAFKETDTACTVFYNADGQITKSYPTVNGQLFDVSDIFKSISSTLKNCSYLGHDGNVENKAYSLTEINAGGERYAFTVYDSDILKFEYKNITEFYKLDNADKFRNSDLWIMMDYMDYIADSFVSQLSESERSISKMAAMLDENAMENSSPQDWAIFRNISLISDANAVMTEDNETSRKYRLSFYVESIDPSPFKNGKNVYEMVISENSSGETRITSLAERDD